MITEGGKIFTVELPGDGRISWARSAHGSSGEVRFYRNATTKVFDGVMPNVAAVFSNKATVNEQKPELTATEKARELSPKEIDEIKAKAAKRAEEALVEKVLENYESERYAVPTTSKEW